MTLNRRLKNNDHVVVFIGFAVSLGPMIWFIFEMFQEDPVGMVTAFASIFVGIGLFLLWVGVDEAYVEVDNE